MRALHGRNVWHFCQVIADALDAAMTYGAAPKSSGRPSGQVRRVGEPRRNVAPEDREGQDRTYWNWSGDRALCGRVDDARHRVPPRRRGPAPRFDGLVRDGGVDRAPAGLWCPVRRAGTTGPGGHRAAARRDRSARGSDAVALLGRWPRRPPRVLGATAHVDVVPASRSCRLPRRGHRFRDFSVQQRFFFRAPP